MGPERNTTGTDRVFGSSTIGLQVSQGFPTGWYDFVIWIRYRTLFLLAMIPWIITLIRLIRSCKRMRVMLPETVD